MRRLRLLVVVVSGACSSSSHGVAVPAPLDGASPETACSALAHATPHPCAEGLDPSCVAVLTRVADARLIDPRRVQCLAAVRTVDDARACGEACK